MVIAAGIGAAGAIGGAVISSSAASSAAGKQNASSFAALVNSQQQQVNAQDLVNPFIGFGTAALGNQYAEANNLMGQAQPYLDDLGNSVPKGMTEAELVQTPGYQFNLSQGLQATQNAAAARGLGVSGAALKGAASYATGLADSTYQNQFNNQQTEYSDKSNNLTQFLGAQGQQFNQQGALSSLGGNMLTNLDNQNLSYTTGNNANIINNGTAQGAATIAGANALTSGLNSLGNAAQSYNTNQLLSGLTGSTSPTALFSGSQYSDPGIAQTNALIGSGQFNSFGTGYGLQ